MLDILANLQEGPKYYEQLNVNLLTEHKIKQVENQ